MRYVDKFYGILRYTHHHENKKIAENFLKTSYSILMRIKPIVLIEVLVISTIVALVIFLFRGREEPLPQMTLNEKKIEVKGSVISGYNEGKLAWQLEATYIWAGSNKFLFKAEGVRGGRLYNTRGELIADGIQAEQIKANSRSKTLNADGRIVAYFIQTSDRQKGQAPRRYCRVTADEMRYYHITNRFYLNGHVVIEQAENVIRPLGEVEVDCLSGIAYLRNGLTLDSPDLTMNALELSLFINEDRMAVSRNIHLQRKPLYLDAQKYDQREVRLRALATQATCARLNFINKKNGRVVELTGGFVLWQPDKQITGQAGSYDEQKEEFEAEGEVLVQSDKLDWLVDKRRKNKFKNPDIASAAEQKSSIKCRNLFFNAKTQDLTLSGDVNFEQEWRKVRCGRLAYNDKTSMITLSGGVKVENLKEKTFLNCRKIIIDLNKEDFKANEQIQVDLKINKKEEK